MSVEIIATAIASFLAGVGTSHIYILRRQGKHSEALVGMARDIKTAFNRIDQVEKRAGEDRREFQVAMSKCITMHTETLGAMGKLIDQNNILIHREFPSK